MAIQILPKGPSLGELLGTGLGSGLSQGLQQLAQQKMMQLQERQQQGRTSKGLEALGVPQDQAQLIAGLPEKLQQQAIRNISSAGQQQLIAQLLGGQEAPVAAEQGIAALQQPAQQGINLLQSPLGTKELLDVAKFKQKEKMIGAKEKALAFKETKEARKDIIDSAKADKENLMRIERMSPLNKEGKLNNPIFYSLLNKVGLDIPALLSPESQEFQKLTIDFLKNAKKMFGARITNFEAETFLKSIPSLTQTTEGRDRVIHNFKMLYQGSDLRSKAMRDIIKENNGTPPLDLLEQIEARVDKDLDLLAADFKKGLISEQSKQISQQGVSGLIGKTVKSSDIDKFPVGSTSKPDANGNVWEIVQSAEGKKWQLKM